MRIAIVKKGSKDLERDRDRAQNEQTNFYEVTPENFGRFKTTTFSTSNIVIITPPDFEGAFTLTNDKGQAIKGTYYESDSIITHKIKFNTDTKFTKKDGVTEFVSKRYKELGAKVALIPNKGELTITLEKSENPEGEAQILKWNDNYYYRIGSQDFMLAKLSKSSEDPKFKAALKLYRDTHQGEEVPEGLIQYATMKKAYAINKKVLTWPTAPDFQANACKVKLYAKDGNFRADSSASADPVETKLIELEGTKKAFQAGSTLFTMVDLAPEAREQFNEMVTRYVREIVNKRVESKRLAAQVEQLVALEEDYAAASRRLAAMDLLREDYIAARAEARRLGGRALEEELEAEQHAQVTQALARLRDNGAGAAEEGSNVAGAVFHYDSDSD